VGIIIISIIVLNIYGDKINVERYTSFTEIGSDYNVTSPFGRLAIWKERIQLILYFSVSTVMRILSTEQDNQQYLK